jgi:hypothetical protein
VPWAHRRGASLAKKLPSDRGWPGGSSKLHMDRAHAASLRCAITIVAWARAARFFLKQPRKKRNSSKKDLKHKHKHKKKKRTKATSETRPYILAR